MNIGSINQDFYQGNITWNAAPIQEYWQTSLAGVSLGGVSLGISSPVVVIDSGSSLLYFSKSAVLLFYSKIPGATEIGGGLFSYTCGYVFTSCNSSQGKLLTRYSSVKQLIYRSNLMVSTSLYPMLILMLGLHQLIVPQFVLVLLPTFLVQIYGS